MKHRFLHVETSDGYEKQYNFQKCEHYKLAKNKK